MENYQFNNKITSNGLEYQSSRIIQKYFSPDKKLGMYIYSFDNLKSKNNKDIITKLPRFKLQIIDVENQCEFWKEFNLIFDLYEFLEEEWIRNSREPSVIEWSQVKKFISCLRNK